MANLVARSAYQMGKTPLLPLFAAGLGASDAFLGIIVSVSTLTGMVFKPFIGALSDRWGRRIWLLIGTAFFALMPFTYWLVHTPAQLFTVRVIHGMATAIYGPVTLAYVTEQWPGRRAERLGWFDSARTAGYILGPSLAGWLLLYLSPPAIFTIIGLISCALFIPILSLPESVPPVHAEQRKPILNELRASLAKSTLTPAVWIAGGLESAAYVATYAMKAFLPIYELAQGTNVAVIGLFFGVQEGVTLVLKPAGGKFGDRIGQFPATGLGMLLMGLTFLILPAAKNEAALLAAAVLIGISQALIFPATTALVAEQIHGNNLGAGMGLLGTLGNVGKVVGPVMGGLLIGFFDFKWTFFILAGLLVIGAAAIGTGHLRNLQAAKRIRSDQPAH